MTQKASDLIGVIRGCTDSASQTLACLTLANRVMSQCDGQVSKINQFAFPLAYVCVKVAAKVPAFMDILLAKLHQVRLAARAGHGSVGDACGLYVHQSRCSAN